MEQPEGSPDCRLLYSDSLAQPEERDGFTAFSYFDPQSGKGIVLILRMEDCEQDAFALTLPYIKRGMSAVLTDADNGEKTRYSAGMKIVLPEKRTARLLRLQLG